MTYVLFAVLFGPGTMDAIYLFGRQKKAVSRRLAKDRKEGYRPAGETGGADGPVREPPRLEGGRESGEKLAAPRFLRRATVERGAPHLS